MSALRSLAPGRRLPDSTEFTSAQAEELMRRAIQLHDQRTEAVSLDVVNQTLQSMDVAPDALKRAARELNAELAGPPMPTTPGEAIGQLVLWLVCAWPGITLLAYRDRMAMDSWMPTAAGVFLLALVARSAMREIRRWRRIRALTGAVAPEPVAEP
jgi:hypothetical protein